MSNDQSNSTIASNPTPYRDSTFINSTVTPFSDGMLDDFSTCELSDALLKLGIPHGGYLPGIEMFSPTFTGYCSRKSSASRTAGEPNKPKEEIHTYINYGIDMDKDNENETETEASFRLCGPAFTVRIVDSKLPDAPPKMAGGVHFVDLIERGSVVVIESPPYLKNAVWGGLMTAGAQSRGARGVVISGRCRDLAEHRVAKFPVFARGHSTVGSGAFARCTNVQTPIEIRSIESGGHPSSDRIEGSGEREGSSRFPGVVVRPGDYIVADADGVVCVPHELVERVKEVAAVGRAADAGSLEDIKAGNGVAASFKKWRGQ